MIYNTVKQFLGEIEQKPPMFSALKKDGVRLYDMARDGKSIEIPFRNITISEFEITGLNREYKDGFFAPYVTESNIQLGIEFKEKIDISINNTTLIIGEIIQVYIPEDCLYEDGFVDIEKANSITCSGFDSYHKTVQLDRLSYAKPNQDLTSLLNKH